MRELTEQVPAKQFVEEPKWAAHRKIKPSIQKLNNIQ
jgi:hypothetical protein